MNFSKHEQYAQLVYSGEQILTFCDHLDKRLHLLTVRPNNVEVSDSCTTVVTREAMLIKISFLVLYRDFHHWLTVPIL